MNILFYFPTSQSSVSLETLMEEFGKKGHQIFLLGTEERGAIHDTVEKFGVHTETYVIPRSPSYRYYFKHFRYLRKFIVQKKIDLVYSHTQPVNIIAVFAQYISRAKFYICRHHSDYIMKEGNRNAVLFDKVINRLGKDFIVPSKKVYDQMTKVEGVNNKNIRLINYAYNFEHYQNPNFDNVASLRNEYGAKLILCAVSRFIPCKRYDLLISCVADLIQKGFDLSLIILGEGPLKKKILQLASAIEHNDRFHFVGFKKNVIDYIAASDMVVHFSDSEASNSVIKEAGLLKKLVAVCHDVGDFEDYIEDCKSGFMISKNNPCPDFKSVVERVYESPEKYIELGANLHDTVLANFSVENVLNAYTEI